MTQIDTMNKSYLEIVQYSKENYDDDALREMIRNYFSRNLMFNDEENPVNCDFPFENEDTFALSSSEMLRVKKIWQHPSEGWIVIVFENDDDVELDDLSTNEMLSLLREFDNQLDLDWDEE